MIYVDSCLLIYAMEDAGARGSRARALLAAGEEQYAISPLVMHEALVMPLRFQDVDRRTEYESLFAEFALVELDIDAYLFAAELRAASPGLKTAGALHLAAAQLAGCSALWTDDRRLAAASGSFAVDVIDAG